GARRGGGRDHVDDRAPPRSRIALAARGGMTFSGRMEPADQNRPLAGILWMLATGMAFVVVTGTVRYLGTDLPAAQSAFIRFLYGLAFLAPALVPALRRGLPAGTWRLVTGRGALHVL